MLSGLIEHWLFFILFLFTRLLMRKWFIPRIAGYENDCIVLWKRECWFSKGVFLVTVNQFCWFTSRQLSFVAFTSSFPPSLSGLWALIGPIHSFLCPPILILLFLSVLLLCMLTWLIFELLNKSTSSWMKNISI